MSTICTCPVPCTTIRFDADVVLLRCSACDTQRWTLAGREVSVAVAHEALAVAFVAHRGSAVRTAA